jgi:hypothetical protein
MKILSVRAVLVHEETETCTKGRADITKPIVAFRKSLNAPINRWRRAAKQKTFFSKEFGKNWTLEPYAARMLGIKKWSHEYVDQITFFVAFIQLLCNSLLFVQKLKIFKLFLYACEIWFLIFYWRTYTLALLITVFWVQYENKSGK